MIATRVFLVRFAPGSPLVPLPCEWYSLTQRFDEHGARAWIELVPTTAHPFAAGTPNFVVDEVAPACVGQDGRIRLWSTSPASTSLPPC